MAMPRPCRWVAALGGGGSCLANRWRFQAHAPGLHPPTSARCCPGCLQMILSDLQRNDAGFQANRGRYLEVADEQGCTPLTLAAARGHLPCVKLVGGAGRRWGLGVCVTGGELPLEPACMPSSCGRYCLYGWAASAACSQRDCRQGRYRP